jgi:D-inositol-3-phosphate glycosyltransferase
VFVRILQYNLTTTTKQGGVETFVWELSRELAARGHAVTLLGGAARGGTQATLLRHEAGVRVVRAPFLDRSVWQLLPPLRRAYAIVKLLERLSLLPGALPLAAGHWDVVHIHKPYDLPLLGLLRRRAGRTVYHGHGGDFYPGDQQLMNLADTLLSCSAFNAGQLHERYGRDATVVFNGYDTAHFVPHQPDPALRVQFAGPDEPLLIYAGRLMPWKGVAHLIGGLARLQHQQARLLVLVANDAPQQQAELLQLARQSGVAQRVAFVGPVAHRATTRSPTWWWPPPTPAKRSAWRCSKPWAAGAQSWRVALAASAKW